MELTTSGSVQQPSWKHFPSIKNVVYKGWKQRCFLCILPWRCCRLMWCALDIFILTTGGVGAAHGSRQRLCLFFPSTQRLWGITSSPWISLTSNSNKFPLQFSKVSLCNVQSEPQTSPWQRILGLFHEGLSWFCCNRSNLEPITINQVDQDGYSGQLALKSEVECHGNPECWSQKGYFLGHTLDYSSFISSIETPSEGPGAGP